MPQLNGIEVASIMKKKLPHSKMLLFTMYSDHVGENLAAAVGVSVVLPKIDGVRGFTHAVESLLQDDSTSHN
jgi:DNA-binding NarL/FixJ family response regulator